MLVHKQIKPTRIHILIVMCVVSKSCISLYLAHYWSCSLAVRLSTLHVSSMLEQTSKKERKKQTNKQTKKAFLVRNLYRKKVSWKDIFASWHLISNHQHFCLAKISHFTIHYLYQWPTFCLCITYSYNLYQLSVTCS